MHNLMFAAFKWAKTKKIGLITRNLFENEGVDRSRRSQSDAQSFTVEQAQRTLEGLVTTKHADALIFSLAAVRRGETCGLKCALIDLGLTSTNAEQWFRGANPVLDFAMPVDALREGRYVDVLSAVKTHASE